ncbi:MAG TPA: hypothetical protein VK464_29040 [Symbiobacteriaceae bacterium]|jgi:hypothetical protein|nr:hypothetical protein [Symbiobacteriaceae bacterium]
MREPDLIPSTAAARLLGVSVATLKRHESGPPSRRVTSIFGGVLRVYWTSYPNGERRFSRREIEALLARKSG